MMEVRASYTFDGSFSIDHSAEEAAGRPPDFSGYGFGVRDLGWKVGSELEAVRIKRALSKIGLYAEVHGDG